MARLRFSGRAFFLGPVFRESNAFVFTELCGWRFAMRLQFRSTIAGLKTVQVRDQSSNGTAVASFMGSKSRGNSGYLNQREPSMRDKIASPIAGGLSVVITLTVAVITLAQHDGQLDAD